MSEFSHIDKANRPTMVDVGGKAVTHRVAQACGYMVMPPEIMAHFRDGELHSKKGPVFHTAIVAGVMAAKRTSEAIPFCHPLPLEDCQVTIEVEDENRLRIDCRVSIHHKTGVEMEALHGVSVAALTIYDMCKGISHEMRIEGIRLVEKHGGKRDVNLSD